MTEAFDIERLAFCQRTLPLPAISTKLRCACGSRRLELIAAAHPAPHHYPNRAILWVA
jgi:hypothetical protein